MAESFGIHTHYLEKTKSTNADANIYKYEDSSLHLFCSDSQSAGKGRFDRVWETGESGGQIYSSWSFAVEKPCFYAPLLIGAQMHQFLCQFFSKDFKLKVPNDIYLNNKKVLGILCEASQTGEQNRITVGIGINLYSHPEVEVAGKIIEKNQLDEDSFLESFVKAILNIQNKFSEDSSQLRTYLCQNAVLQNAQNIDSIDPEFNFYQGSKKTPWSDL